MEYDIYEKPVQVFPPQEESKKKKPLQGNDSIPNTEGQSTDILIIDDSNTPSTNPQEMERLIREQIEYEIMCQQYDRRQLDNLVSVMTEVMLCTSGMIAVSREKSYPSDYVWNSIRNVGPMHIEQIMESLMTRQPEIRNIRGYLLTALINSVNTMEIGYQYGEEYIL